MELRTQKEDGRVPQVDTDLSILKRDTYAVTPQN